MSEILGFEHFKAKIAEKCGVNNGFADAFIDSVLSVMKSGLEKDGEVCIDGLGVFKVKRTHPNDIAHLIFIADDKLKKGINSPFDLFSPMVIKEGVHSVNEEAKDALDNVAVADVIDEDALQDVQTETDSEADEEISVFDYREAEFKMYEPEQIEKEKDDLTIVSNTDVNDTIINENQKEQENVLKIDEDMKSEKKKDDINKRDLSNQKNVDMKQDEEKNLPGVKDEASSLSKRNIIWVIVILLGIAIVGTMWFFFFRVINTEPKIDNGSLPTVIIDEPQSQNITKPVEEKVVAPAAKPVQEKKILTKHTLKSGERYFRLSELYYGSTFFWPYIYEANKDRYPNPAIIYKRDYVDIPDLASWGIDVNDPKELEIAKQKCVELVKSGVFEE